jgi:hypothetical protein
MAMGIPSFQQKVPDHASASFVAQQWWIDYKQGDNILFDSSSSVLTSWIMSIRQFPVFTKRNS